VNEYIYTSSIVFPSNDNIIYVSSSYGNMSNFLRWLKDNVNWILILVTKPTIGYGYVLTLDEDARSWNMLKSCCSVMIYYASINYSYWQCILTIKLLYLKFLVKMSMKFTYENDRQMY